jgi:SNF2 family DNA or RNA helicase
MEYTVESGLLKIEGRELSAEEIYRKGRLEVFTENGNVFLSVSKRPAKITFSFDIAPAPVFSISFRGNSLSESQTYSLRKSGYFIDFHQRVHFVSEQVKSYLIQAFATPSVPKLLSLLRSLHHDQLLEFLPDNLIERLSQNEKPNNQAKKLFEKELYPYQKEGVSWLSFCTRHGLGTILADDMGLGKTAQVIALTCETLEIEPESRILIVVPNPLLDNWKREFAFFAPSITPFIHYGKNRHGLASGLLSYRVIITPYTTMTTDITLFEDLHFRLVLFDEASMLKNPISSRSIAAKRLLSDVKVAMSGTPVENSLIDAWALSDLVFEGYLGDLESFSKEYVNPDIRHTLESNLYELEQSLRQITLRRMKKDVLDQLPAKRDIHLAVTAGQQEREGYEAIIAAMQDDIKNGGGGILPLINRLQQYTAHPALLDSSTEKDVGTLIASSAKFELMMMQLDKIRASGEKVLIFATFRKAIDLIESAVREKYRIAAGVIDGRTPNEERQPLIDNFSASQGFNVLILHPRTAGMGFNITAANNVIHYCRQWNPALEAQATARAWRNGQKETVSVFYMFYANTVEETIDERIRLKQELSERVVSVTNDKETDKQIMINYLESLK